jgi:hypothetical protein
MKKQKDKIITDINSFDEEVSIYKILFQDRTTSTMKYLIDKLSLDRYENRNFNLPSIMIAGKEGKQLIARAFANSLCCNFEHIIGSHLGRGGSCQSLYENNENVDEDTIYYISSADKLTTNSITQFHNFLQYHYVKFRNPISEKEQTVRSNNKLFIFGVDDYKKLSKDIYKSIEHHCYLTDIRLDNLYTLIEQRLRWCGVEYEQEVPTIIAVKGKGSISKCIRLLSACYLVMRGSGRSKITVKDLEIGLGLSKEELQIDPADMVDDELLF